MRGFELKIPAEPCYLRVVRTAVEAICLASEIEEETRCKVVLAVDEACSNIIRHSYEGACDMPIIFSAEIENGTISFHLRDFGKKVDPSCIQSRPLEEVRPGGLGVHFIQEVMDSVDYQDCGEEGTLLHLRKRIHSEGGSS